MMTNSVIYPDVIALEKQFLHLTTGSTNQEDAPVKVVKKKKKKVKGLSLSDIWWALFTWYDVHSQQLQQRRQVINQWRKWGRKKLQQFQSQ